MRTEQIKEEVDKNLERLRTLRDEIRVQLHLASLDAKQEWDEKLAPKLFEVEQSAKEKSEPARMKAKELVDKLEEFLEHLREKMPHSRH